LIETLELFAEILASFVEVTHARRVDPLGVLPELEALVPAAEEADGPHDYVVVERRGERGLEERREGEEV
jgi:hypothetical protein